ncbi:MAG TPA: archaellin/type IV pilin N-terminal domain-containing protein [Candidatus Thalassarchaeaceae archaeon]|jgi:flagellin-like protein|nr:archaellin/type IV pilin N-terminal domain-containing protein [Candidatus Thalassarchaeaceae archaeon]
MKMKNNEKRMEEERAVSPVIATILMVAITVVLAGVLYVWANNLASEGTGTTMSTLNTYTAEDADDETGVGADDTLVKMQMTGKDELSWSFVKITISIGDNVYTCSVIAGDDCEIGQAAGDNDNAWEPSEYLFLKEGTEDICDGTVCPITISITNGGRSVGGSPLILVDGTSGSNSVGSTSTGGTTVTTESCADVFAVIETQEDVSNYAHCTDLDALYLHQTSGVTEVNLPHLEKIYRYAYFHQNSDLEMVSLPKLEEVEKYVYFHKNPSLESVDLSSLEDVGNNDDNDGGYVYFYHNYALESVDLSSLKNVYVNEYGDQGYVYFDNNDVLLSIDMSSLEHVGGYLYISGHDILTTIDLTSSLTAVDDYVYIYSNPDLCVPSLNWNDISDSVSMGGNGQCTN